MTTTMLILEKENITVDLELEPHQNYFKDPKNYDYYLHADLKFTIMVNGKLKRCSLDIGINRLEESDSCSSNDIIIQYEPDKYVTYNRDYHTTQGALKILSDLGYFSFDEFSTTIIQRAIKSVMQPPMGTLSSN